ncbi:hypothetical protein ACSLPA_13990, partial [Escherichia coli]
MRVLIKNGTVVNADGQAKQDLLIESGIVRQGKRNSQWHQFLHTGAAAKY